MLYTFSKAQYDLNELTKILTYITKNDAVVLWQDGILQAVKYPSLFANKPTIFILENDMKARGLDIKEIKVISLSELVKLTETYFPQIAL